MVIAAWGCARARRVALVLLVATGCLSALDAQSENSLTRIALFEPMGQSQDPTLTAVLSTVADSVELSLVVLQRYDVRRLPPADPVKDLPRVRSYCETNHIDQAILGSGGERSEGGFDFRLLVYDRRSDSITIDRQGSSTGALDMFDTTDSLVASLLDGLSGTHLLFGSLTVDTDPPGATVSVNGRDAGQGPVSLRGLPVGTVQLVARSAGHEDAQASVTISDGETASATLKLARSMGRLSVQMPTDGRVSVASAEIGQKQLSGPGVLDLPTGDYQLQATSPGLAAVSAQLTVGRNATANWLPWTKGYLAVQTVPDGASVVVDGVARGAAPQVVEVDPGTLHRVQVTRDKYDTYVADLSATEGTKTLVAAELAGLPGSVSVVTSIPGAKVRLDDGFATTTPAVFKDVPAGNHLVTILPLQSGDRALTAGPPIAVTVSPGDRTDVVKDLVQGVGLLKIRDAPAGSVVEIEGMDTVDSAKALADGFRVPAGVVRVSVTAHLVRDRISSPITGEWTSQLYMDPDATLEPSIYSMKWQIPRRTVVIGGGLMTLSGWSGILPLWTTATSGVGFKDQPGTQISGGYVCRDDTYLYVRYDFSNGSPSTKLIDELKQVLAYNAFIYTDHRGDQVHMNVDFSRTVGGGVSAITKLFIWNDTTKAFTDLGGGNLSYTSGDGSLIIRVPLDPIKPYVQGSCEINLNVVDEDYQGQSRTGIRTERMPVAFGF